MGKTVVTILIVLAGLASAGTLFAQDDATDVEETSPVITMTEEELQRLVESSVAKRLRPLQREIAELKNETKLHDILGGIGYICGLAGVALYFLAGKKRAEVKN